jgi:hypothetical protein
MVYGIALALGAHGADDPGDLDLLLQSEGVAEGN